MTRAIRRCLPLLTAAVVLSMPGPAGAASAVSRMDGGCSFSGPIRPAAPIGVVPVPGAHFSFDGRGTCSGHLDATTLAAAPVEVVFENVQTAFDTCEFGPDVNLAGTLTVAGSRFDITVDLARVLLTGPLRLTTAGGGLASGSAQFQPADASAAPGQCVGAELENATLTASFTTLSALVGARGPAPAQGSGPARKVRPAPRHRHHRHRRPAPRRHGRVRHPDRDRAGA